MRRLIGVCVLSVLLGGNLLMRAEAGPPYRVINPQPHYNPPVLDHQHIVPHRRIVRVDITTVAQINPAYTSTYNEQGYDSTTQSDILQELRRLSVRLDQLNTTEKAQMAALIARLAATPTSIMPRVEGTTPPVPPVIIPPLPTPVPALPATGLKGQSGGGAGLTVLTTHCAACHQSGKLAPDQRFTLLDVKGNLSQLTAAQKFKVLTKVYSGQMPPPQNTAGATPVDDAGFAAIVDLLSGG